MHSAKKVAEQKKRFLLKQEVGVTAEQLVDPPLKKKTKKELSREEAEQRRKHEEEQSNARMAEVRRFMRAFVDFLKEYDDGIWDSSEGGEAVMKLASETSRMRNIMVKKLTKPSKKEGESAAEVGAPIENTTLASFSARVPKKEKPNEKEKKQEDEMDDDEDN